MVQTDFLKVCEMFDGRNHFNSFELQERKTLVSTSLPNYGSISPPTQEDDGCCYCLRTLNSSEAPSLMDRNPSILSCPNCLSPVYPTRRRYTTDRSTHVAAILLLPLCLCLLPYYLQCCKSVRHHCPVCDTYIGYSI